MNYLCYQRPVLWASVLATLLCFVEYKSSKKSSFKYFRKFENYCNLVMPITRKKYFWFLRASMSGHGQKNSFPVPAANNLIALKGVGAKVSYPFGF